MNARSALLTLVLLAFVAPASVSGATPQRIVSLSPTLTEDLFAIGAGKQVVAVDDQSNYPVNAPKTKLSGFKPNVEAIVKYKPDLVVLSNDTNKLVSKLKALDIAVALEPSATTLADSYSELLALGKLTGHAQGATKVVAGMKAQIAKIVAAVPKRATPLTYYHELDQTYYSVTSKTFIGKIYSLLGLRNIADTAPGVDKSFGYPKLSSEFIVNANPDLIFLADTKCCKQNAAAVAKRPGWEGITAVIDKHVVALDDDVASRWGPRIVIFLRTVAAQVAAVK